MMRRILTADRRLVDIDFGNGWDAFQKAFFLVQANNGVWVSRGGLARYNSRKRVARLDPPTTEHNDDLH